MLRVAHSVGIVLRVARCMGTQRQIIPRLILEYKTWNFRFKRALLYAHKSVRYIEDAIDSTFNPFKRDSIFSSYSEKS